MTSQAVSIVIQLGSTITLARLLSPADYGIMAMVMAVTSFAGLFRDLGLSSAAIQKKELSTALQSNLFWLNVAMGTALTVIVAAGSPLVAWFYLKPELVNVTLALSLSFLIGSLGTQHGARLVREMKFGRQAIANIAGALVTLVVSLVLAIRGYSYWSLVWGSLSGSLTTTMLLIHLSPFRPGLPGKSAGMREVLAFGGNITAFDLANYFSRNSDNLLIGRMWGDAALGLYSRAYQLMMFPINAIRGPINAVAFPAMSRLQDNPQGIRDYYQKATNVLAWTSMPISAFLWASSDDVITVILGTEWQGVGPIFSWLAVAAFIQPSSGFLGSLLLSLGLGRRYLISGIANSIVVVVGFLIGVKWGPIGIACSYALCNYALIIPWYKLALAGTPVNIMDFFRACAAPALTSAASAGIAWIGVGQLEIASPFVRILVSALIFGAAFLLMMALVPPVKRELLRLTRNLMAEAMVLKKS
jgi:PST family polysaccharide transporter